MDLALTPRSSGCGSGVGTRRGYNVPRRANCSDRRLPPEQNCQGFSADQAAGLFALATERFTGPLPPSLSYWREFASRYLTELCHTPRTTGAELPAIAPPAGDFSAMLENAPPMQGAEYLNEAVLDSLWQSLDHWVRQNRGDWRGIVRFPAKPRPALAPGRARLLSSCREQTRRGLSFCFFGHLRAAGDGRFADSISAAERALKEMAGAKNKPALVRLLSPIVRAAKKASLSRNWSSRATSINLWHGRRGRRTNFSRTRPSSRKAAS